MKTVIYIRKTRNEALMLSLTRHYGLEVPLGYLMPRVTMLADTMPRYPRKFETYYTDDGGPCWPARVLVESCDHGAAA